MTRRWLDDVARVPASRPAVSDGGGALTYGSLCREARQLATVVHATHGEGRMLLIRADPSIAFVRAVLATMWSGNTPVPIDPTLPPAAVAYIAERAGAAGPLEITRPEEGERETDAYDPIRPALVMFTSGTSGRPKGVVVSDANLRFSCAAISDYLDYRTHDSAAVVLPLFYSYALISQVLCMLAVGGRLRLFSDLKNPLRVAAAIEQGRLATFCGVPSTFQALHAFRVLRPFSMSSVRVVCSAGAALEGTQLGHIRDIFPNATVFNNYGMTEACPRIAYVRDDDPRFGEGTCGRPLPGIDVRIVDPGSGALMPDGEPGMLVLRGPNVTQGYLNEPDLTREAFTADGYLRSGDLARLDRGYIFIEGRCDDVFNCGGEKIAPLEIERALLLYPGVEVAAVVGVPHELRGLVPVAFLRCSDAVRRHDLVSHLSQHIAKSKVPARFLRVSVFPTTSNGKVLRRALSVESTSVMGELL
jgi:acyl-CoA synthetase (AMP-forming)/AMP-acid ligase II